MCIKVFYDDVKVCFHFKQGSDLKKAVFKNYHWREIILPPDVSLFSLSRAHLTSDKKNQATTIQTDRQVHKNKLEKYYFWFVQFELATERNFVSQSWILHKCRLFIFVFVAAGFFQEKNLLVRVHFAKVLRPHLLDHHDLLLATIEEPELVNHHLDDVFEVRPHGLEFAEVAELVLKQGRPPADGQVFAVHTIVLAHLSDSEI